MKLRLIFCSAVLCLSGLGCATGSSQEGEAGLTAPTNSYADLVEQWSDNDKAYEGITQSYGIGATLLTIDILEGQTYSTAQEYHWSADQFNSAKQKALDEARKGAKIFLSVYTEKLAHNKLDMKNSLWNVFLDVAGKRITPKSIKKISEEKLTLMKKYPYHNTWGIPYEVTFPIDTVILTDAAKASGARLVIAGPIGGVTLRFPKK